MWIVKLALRQPYTFIVMALLIPVLGVVAIYRTAVDIFPVVNIPVVSVIWTYIGMPPEELKALLIQPRQTEVCRTLGAHCVV